MRRTFNDNPWDVSIAAIFLASKIEYEYTSRVSRYLIHECARTAKKINESNYELNKREKEYGYWKNNMLYYETEILRVLYYDLNVDEPYSYCTKWCKNYNVPMEEEAIINYLLNESYIKTVLCLQYPAKTLAAGAFVLASYHNKNIDWKKWIKESNIPANDIKDVSLKLKDMLTKVNEKSPIHHPHKFISNKAFSLQDFVKSPSPLKISTINNDIDKNNTDNFSNITKTQLLSSPPKSDNSDNHEKENKIFKAPETNNEIQPDSKHSSNENEDWEVVDMDIDDDEDAIPNPNTNTNPIIIENKDMKNDEPNYYNKDNSINNAKYDNYKNKSNYPYYSNSRKHYPPPPSYHFSRSRSRGGSNYYSSHYSYSRSYSNNYSNSSQSYYRGNNSYYRSSSNRGGNSNNYKLNNPINGSTGGPTNANSGNMNNLSPKGSGRPRNPNYFPQY
jgi:hypothetical protein